MNPTTIKLNMNTVTMGDNPRLPTTLKIPALAENIEGIGLTDPIHVWSPEGNNIYEVIRGHRRTMALAVVKDRNPKRYKELFKDGVNAILWEDITAEEVVTLKLDHGGQETLADPHELQMSANIMFAKNFNEAQVANQLKPLITRISPMGAKQKTEVEELEAALTAAKVAKDEKAIEKAEKDLSERVANMYRGRVQHLHHVYRCPNIVNASLFFKACGEKPVDFKDEILPKLTTSQVSSLWKAHKEDLEITDEETQAPKYNKGRVGPNFSTKWEAILKAEATGGKEKVKQDKAMSAKDMKLEVTEGKWASVGFCKLTQHHAGNKSIDGLEALDSDYKAMDLVRQNQPELYEMVKSEAAKVEAELIAADKKAAKADAETEEG